MITKKKMIVYIKKFKIIENNLKIKMKIVYLKKFNV